MFGIHVKIGLLGHGIKGPSLQNETTVMHRLPLIHAEDQTKAVGKQTVQVKMWIHAEAISAHCHSIKYAVTLHINPAQSMIEYTVQHKKNYCMHLQW